MNGANQREIGQFEAKLSAARAFIHEAAYAKIAPQWRASSEYADVMAKAKASGAKIVDQVHYREL